MTRPTSVALSPLRPGLTGRPAMRRDTGEFIKTARRGSVYAAKGGRFYIKRQGSSWLLFERADGWIVLGTYSTLAEAVSGFRTLGKDSPVNS